MSAYRTVAEHPGLRAVETPWLHVTVLHAGPQEEASGAEIAKMVVRVGELVRAEDVGPVELTLARPAPGTQAIECAARPGAPARRLWELTRQATLDVVGDRWAVQPQTDYYPHLSVAYGGPDAGRADRRRLKALISDVDQDEVVMRVDRLSLVAQWHDHARIMWKPLATVPLTRAMTMRAAESSGRQPGHTYVRLAGGPVDGQLLDVTGWTKAALKQGAMLLTDEGEPSAWAVYKPRLGDTEAEVWHWESRARGDGRG